MDIRVLNETVTSHGCEVSVDGMIFFVFEEVNGKLWKIREYYYQRTRPHVPRSDFIEARRQAECAVTSKKNGRNFPARTGTFEPNEEMVRMALYWGRNILHNNHASEVITEWLRFTARWTTQNEKEMRSIAAKANVPKAQRTRARKRRQEQLREDAARQFELF